VAVVVVVILELRAWAYNQLVPAEDLAILAVLAEPAKAAVVEALADLVSQETQAYRLEVRAAMV
jgi:hypothetical protein